VARHEPGDTSDRLDLLRCGVAGFRLDTVRPLVNRWAAQTQPATYPSHPAGNSEHPAHSEMCLSRWCCIPMGNQRLRAT
jgi:hypothetical protein